MKTATQEKEVSTTKTETTATPTTALTARDRRLFIAKEHVLEHHFGTFKQAGEALIAIRDKRLYRENHATFEAYCRERWDMSKTQANRLISAAQVMGNVETPETHAVTSRFTEGSVRPLTTLKPETQKRVVEKLARQAPKEITAKLVTDTARSIAPKEVPKKKEANGHGRGGGDLVRRSEFLEELSAWEKTHKSSGTFANLTPAAVLTQVRKIINSL